MKNIEKSRLSGKAERKSRGEISKVLRAKSSNTIDSQGQIVRKKMGKKVIRINLKDICSITNNPGPAKAPITNELLERVHAERLRKLASDST